ncbi:hypothetical protein THAOC_00301, partial [Thalassiosira oceanica]
MVRFLVPLSTLSSANRDGPSLDPPRSSGDQGATGDGRLTTKANRIGGAVDGQGLSPVPRWLGSGHAWGGVSRGNRVRNFWRERYSRTWQAHEPEKESGTVRGSRSRQHAARAASQQAAAQAFASRSLPLLPRYLYAYDDKTRIRRYAVDLRCCCCLCALWVGPPLGKPPTPLQDSLLALRLTLRYH